MEMFTQAIVAIDGSKFKAVNSKDRNDTKASMKRRIARVELHIERYLSLLDDVDKDEPSVRDTKVPELEEKIAALKERMQQLKKRERDVLAHPDQQISETDPDSRLMKKGGMGSQVSYNVQTAVDTKHKLIVAHDVTNAAVDRNQLFPLAGLAQHTLQHDEIKVLADRGYYKGEAIKDCYDAGIEVLVPKTLTSNSRAAGRFDKEVFNYEEETDSYRCPAGETLQRRFTTLEKGKVMQVYFSAVSVCRNCSIKSQCTTSAQRKIRRW